jgi:hypothetical protein
MKAKMLFMGMLLGLIAVSGASYAGKDSPGSSTDHGALHGSGNTGRTIFTEVHSGRSVTPSSHVDHTDAQNDAHPFS